MAWHCSLSAFQIPKSSSKRVGVSPLLLAALKDLKDRSFIPQPFRSISEMWEQLNIPAIKPATHSVWRLTNCLAGSVCGLPVSGLLVATDGMLAVILRCDGRPFIAHYASFEPNEKLEITVQSFDSYEGKRVPVKKAKKLAPRKQIDITEFC